MSHVNISTTDSCIRSSKHFVLEERQRRQISHHGSWDIGSQVFSLLLSCASDHFGEFGFVQKSKCTWLLWETYKSLNTSSMIFIVNIQTCRSCWSLNQLSLNTRSCDFGLLTESKKWEPTQQDPCWSSHGFYFPAVCHLNIVSQGQCRSSESIWHVKSL